MDPKPLDSFFSEPDGAKSSPSPVAEPVQDGAKESPSPAKEEAKPAVEEKAEPKAEDKTEEKPPEEKPQEAKEQAAPTVDWDSDSNPYKSRYKETRSYAERVEQKGSALERQLEVINKKLDGTYDPEKDAVSLQPSTDQAQLMGRISASEAVAKSQYGEVVVEQKLKEFNEKFGQNQMVQARVQLSPAPILEAIKILDEAAFVTKWGNDPAKIEESIRKDEAAKYEAKIEEAVNRKIEERLKKMDTQPQGLTNARGAANGAEPRGWQPAPLSKVFE